VAVSVGVCVPLIRSRGGSVTAHAELWQVAAAALAVMAIYGMIGVSVGALVRNQIAAVVGVLVWMLAVEQVVISSLPAIGRWMPAGATFGLLQLGAEATTRGHCWDDPSPGRARITPHGQRRCGMAHAPESAITSGVIPWTPGPWAPVCPSPFGVSCRAKPTPE